MSNNSATVNLEILSAFKSANKNSWRLEQIFPLVVSYDGNEIDLAIWAKNNRKSIKKTLLKHGAILFRGFNISSVSDFENVVVSICPNLFSEYGDLPRIAESRKIYQSTPYPADRAILIHNESSHLHYFPLNIWFCCLQPSLQGGATPIVDCRKAYRLLNKKLQARLIEKKIMYVRNFIQGLDVSWQTFFQTTDKSMVEDYCRRTDIDFEWGKQNNLTTRQVRPAIAVHPITNERVVFNQIQLYHMAYLESEIKESLLSIFGEDRLPRNVHYGDGTPIEDSVLEEINQVYRESQTSFPWEKGDILMLDNMLTAHGRNPYVGKRQIRVAMGEMRYSKDILPSAV